MTNVLRIGALKSPSLPNYAIKTYNGTTIYVFNARAIQVITEALRLPHEVVPDREGKLGYKIAGGNWTGVLGLLMSSEVDLAVEPMFIDNSEISEEILFSYPCCISDTTFMTNKPEPVPKNMALFHPFSYSVWIALTMILIAVPLLFYFLMNRRVKFLTILFDVFGYLVEQSFTFNVRKNNARILLTGWLLGAMIISYGYKAVLLSSLTFPTMTVIRDIPDLAKAAAQNSVTCFRYPGDGFEYLIDSDIEDWRIIGKCLERNEANYAEDFYSFTSKKARINSRFGLSFDEKDYFISKDSFGFVMFGYPTTKNFCCLRKLNRLINLLNAFGIYKKFEEEDKFFWQFFSKMFKTEDLAPSDASPKITLSDISGAFFILLCGWSLGLLAFIGEIFTYKCIR